MTPERVKLLGELLKEMTRENEFIPKEAWLPLQDAVVTSWVELAVPKKTDQGWELLLTYRKDKNWDGWHIPGGMWKVQYPTFQDICNAVAKRELGTEVEYLRNVYTVKWTKHPFAHPLAIVCICKAKGEILETETTKFFARKEVPSNIINSYHREYIDVIFDDLEKRGT